MKTLSLVFLMVVASQAGDDKFATGQFYRERPESFHLQYVFGYLNGYKRGLEFAVKSLDENTRKIVIAALSTQHFGVLCTVEGERSTIYQMTVILDKYIADHPERWDKEIGQLAEEAFIDACEKRVKKP